MNVTLYTLLPTHLHERRLLFEGVQQTLKKKVDL